MSKIKKVEDRPNFPQMEEKVNQFWKQNQIFQKSVDQRPDTDLYKFVDGPPFVTGMPHYGSLLPSIAKDVIPRYWTMKGKKVRRVFGWDCHGLPIEEKVNKKLGVLSSKDIEERIGIDRYIAECKDFVKNCTSDWRWYIEKVGRWVDMDNAYYTMNIGFMESVIWGFKKIYDKGLIYKGKRVSLYSTDTSTPVSNFEVAMDADNYKDVEDLSIFVKFELKEQDFVKNLGLDKPVYLVAWTTTPWTIPANFALAVNENAFYSLVEYNGEYLITAKDRLGYAYDVESEFIGPEPDKTVQVIKEFKGSELKGLQYKPVYDFFVKESNNADFLVYLSDDVTLDEGTGVLHIAPAFGEVDHAMGLKYGISVIADIDEAGNMTVGPWKGNYLRDASPTIAEDLQERGNLLKSLLYTHRLPFYRGVNPLIYMAQDAYFIDIQRIKDRMLELNMDINWIPEHVKLGRFGKTVATSPDWCISRNRYWATIMPVWLNEDGEEIVVGSIEEMMEYTNQITKETKDGKIQYLFEGNPLDLHKDVADKIVFTKDGKQFRRVPEVLDCWMDSGSVPFAEYHYPFENTNAFENATSADFIVEYVGQVRAWFNVLLRISTIIFDDAPFKNVICTGVLAGNDGRKMSKSYGNYPDPKEVLENIGGEALRLYMMSAPIMVGDDLNWSDEQLKEQVKNILLPVWNTYKYLGIYANLHSWTPKDLVFASDNILDIWVKEYMDKVTKEYAQRIESYNIPASVKLIQEAIDNISSWYIRRSRDRFAANDEKALQTLYIVLVQFIKTFAPQMPFITEEIYQNLVVGAGVKDAKESVHLDWYPEIKEEIDEKLLTDMEVIRRISSLGQSIRVTNGLKVRQPLAKAYIPVEDQRLRDIVKSELNVKEVEYAKEPVEGTGHITQIENTDVKENIVFVTIDTNLTQELKEEGMLNDLTRHIQDFRKKQNMKMEDKPDIFVQTEDPMIKDLLEKHLKDLQKAVNAKTLSFGKGDKEQSIKIEGTEVVVSV